MARIAYVDHSYHRTTRSTTFLPDLLARHGHEVQFFWDEAWQGGRPVAWDEVRSHDVVIMFQSYCPPADRHFRLSHPNVIYIPMLDQFGIWQGPVFNLTAFWEPFQGSKILNFSNALHCMATSFGLASHFVRYYQPLPERLPEPRSGLHGFFWLRREEQLPWRVIRQLIGGARFDSLHLHLATDPGTPAAEPPSAEDIATHNITTSTWFENKQDLVDVMERANVFFAPRLEEGIGQSFLEAMVRGQCVVAPNHGTMNEYIVHGVNGLLYDAGSPRPLDFSMAARLGQQARQGAVAGRLEWERSEDALVRFILAPSEELYRGKYQHPTLSGAQAAGGSDVPPSEALTGWRRVARQYAVFRLTRFLWQPLIQWARRAKRWHAARRT